MLYGSGMDTTSIKKACAVAGGVTALARLLNVTVPTVSEWTRARRPVPSTRCIAIERAVNGKVTRYQLRPDVFGRHA